MNLTKQQKKELRKKYEVEVGKKFFKQMEKQPICSSFEWVDLKMKYKQRFLVTDKKVFS